MFSTWLDLRNLVRNVSGRPRSTKQRFRILVRKPQAVDVSRKSHRPPEQFVRDQNRSNSLVSIIRFRQPLSKRRNRTFHFHIVVFDVLPAQLDTRQIGKSTQAKLHKSLQQVPITIDRPLRQIRHGTKFDGWSQQQFPDLPNERASPRERLVDLRPKSQRFTLLWWNALWDHCPQINHERPTRPSRISLGKCEEAVGKVPEHLCAFRKCLKQSMELAPVFTSVLPERDTEVAQTADDKRQVSLGPQWRPRSMKKHLNNRPE
jgi:hypothetical protein